MSAAASLKAIRSYALDKTTRKLVHLYNIECTNAEDHAAAAAATGLPRLADPLTGDSGLQVESVSIELDQASNNTKRVYRATVTYSTVGWGGFSYGDNPLSRPSITEVSTQQATVVSDRDSSGNMILNSAGMPYPDPPQREQNFIVVTVTRNLPGQFSLTETIAYKDAVNSAAFTILGLEGSIAAGLAKIQNITGKEKYENDVHFWETTISIVIRDAVITGNGVSASDSPWDLILLDSSFVQKSTSQPDTARDKNGIPMCQARPLNGSGVFSTFGSQGQYRVHSIYKRADFSTLSLLR